MAESNLDVDAFMQHVRDNGFTIEDRGLVHSDLVRRFAISNQGNTNYMDIDKLIWNDLPQDFLIRQSDIIMNGMKGDTTIE